MSAATVSADLLLRMVTESGLLAPSVLTPFLDQDDFDAVSLARQLVKERLLTPFQARTLLSGQPFSFFLTDRYKILEHLGKGGMGQVYLGEHLLLRRVVAVKVITPEFGEALTRTGAVDRFFREARAVAALDHANVVRVFDMDISPFGPFIAMEYVDGTNLHTITSKFGPLDVVRAVDVAVQSAAGLAHAHQAGLVHRDVKPGNLLLDRMGTVKVVDLGLARFRDVTENQGLTGIYDNNRIIGTIEFQAPEQGMDSGAADARSDVYSLGASLFHMLTGRPPFPDGTMQNKLLAHQLKPPPQASDFNPGVPRELSAVIAAMMAKRPNDRPQTMHEVRQILSQWVPDTLPLPPSHEMPKHPPSAYRLGLCQPPSMLNSSGILASSPSMGPRSGVYRVQGLGSAPLISGPATRSLVPPASGKIPVREGSAPRILRDSVPFASGPSGEPLISTLVAPPTTQEAENPSGLAATLNRAISRRTMILGIGGGIVTTVLAAGAYSYFSRPVLRSGPITGTGPQPVSPPPPPLVVPDIEIQGSGSTFIKPAMDAWISAYQEQGGGKIIYRGGGSSQGISNLLGGILPFGCTDVAVTEKQFRDFNLNPSDVYHIPLALGAVVPIYKLPGVSKQLQFTGSVLAEIFSGKITNWNHESIQSCNPLVKGIPDLPITVVVRKEGSGTTASWTEYLCKVSKDFEQQIGKGDRVNWRVGEMEQGSNNLTARVKNTDGAIGYTEHTYAIKENVPYAAVFNKQGDAVNPSSTAITAAAAGLDSIPDNLTFSLTNMDGNGVYPICVCTWALVFRRSKVGGPAITTELVKYLRWVVHQGQELLPNLKYAPLPPLIIKSIDAKLATISAG